jgi:hypothetical protein
VLKPLYAVSFERFETFYDTLLTIFLYILYCNFTVGYTVGEPIPYFSVLILVHFSYLLKKKKKRLNFYSIYYLMVYMLCVVILF